MGIIAPSAQWKAIHKSRITDTLTARRFMAQIARSNSTSTRARQLALSIASDLCDLELALRERCVMPGEKP